MKRISVADGHGYGLEYQNAYPVAGVIDVKHGVAVLTGSAATGYTLNRPIATVFPPGAVPDNGDDGKTLMLIAGSAFAHTITLPVKFNTGAAGAGTVTLGGAIGDGITLVAYQGNWLIAPGSKTNAVVA